MKDKKNHWEAIAMKPIEIQLRAMTLAWMG